MSAVKWYKKAAWWQLAVFILTPFAGGGAAMIEIQGWNRNWYLAILFVSGVLAALKYFGKDENKNGKVDILEDKN